MKRSAIQTVPRSAFSRLWPGAALVALPFVFDCAITGCGNSSDGTAPTTPTTSGTPANSDGTSATSNGNTMTVTEPNQPGSSEAAPPATLQNPRPAAGGAAAGRDVDAGAPSTTPVNPEVSGLVACGPAGRFCEKPNLTCCTPGGGAGQGANAATCQASAADCPTGTVTIAECSSAASCAASEVCCRTANPPPAGMGAMGAPGGAGNNGTTASCAATCAAGAAQLCLTNEECGAGRACGNNGTCVAAPCTGAAGGCATGEVCCRGGGGGGAATGACVAPAAGAAAVCPAGQRQLCAVDTDCPVNNTCAPLAAAGGGGGGAAAGVLACTPAPCTPGSCGAGQLCCIGGGGGGGGGAPACAAASAAGACPGNARLVCATDTDCTSVAGTACLTGANGAGGLSCRVPPVAPPPAADAGAGG